jgi:eukaryotic-like serine/threonine-protein kinase
MSVAPPAGDARDDTVSQPCQEGIELAHKARDTGDWKPLVDWLVAHPHCAGQVFEFLAVEQGFERLVTPLRVPVALTTIGRYELRGVLGSGAMGVVYQAFDPKLNRQVAVKLLHPSVELSAGERERFLDEAKAVAKLNHENVVELYDSGEDNGVPYLVMPLLTGGTLAGWLKGLGRRLSPREAAGIARDIALGIHHAHERGLIHRDLKPANILRDDARRVLVADFGLARMTDLTATRIAGTPAYMAPEQAGSGRKLTRAVDVHAIGVILYELLAGGPPFGGGDVATVLRKVAEQAAPLVRTHRDDVPADLEAVIAKCLEKRPDRRYPTAADLADELDNFLHGRPVTAAVPGVFAHLTRAFGRQATPQTSYTWWGFFVGAASTLFGAGWIQAAVLFDAPAWVSWAGLGYYFVAWAVLLLGFLVVREHRLGESDRSNSGAHVGMFLAAVAATLLQLWLHTGDVPPVFGPLLVVIGLAIFTNGTTFAGRLFLDGGVALLAAALLPLVPLKFWPGVYGLLVAVFQVRSGLYLRRLDREAKAAPPT